MKKIYFALAIGTSCVAFAQKGKIGVNNSDPKATLDIQVKAGNTDTNEGILIPRVNKARVKAISSTNRVEGTLVYVTDAVQDSDSATFTGTGKGFYYYDAATQRWVKMGSGAATVIKKPAPIITNQTSYVVSGDEEIIITKAGSTNTVKLPDAVSNSGRVFYISNMNSTASTLTITSDSNVIGTPAILQKRGKTVVSNGIEWVVISYN